jgi:hypothetical protein
MFDDVYAHQRIRSAVVRQPNIYRDFDANLARIVKPHFGTAETSPL